LEQAAYQLAWDGVAAGTHEIVNNRVRRIQAGVPPPAAEPVVRAICNATKKGGAACGKNSTHPDGKCTIHHNQAVRRADNAILIVVRREMKRMCQQRRPAAVLDAWVTAQEPRMARWAFQQLQWELDRLIIKPFEIEGTAMVELGATRGQIRAFVDQLVETGALSQARAVYLDRRLGWNLQAREWREAQARVVAPNALRFGANQREAQLAADAQNVHTAEISSQLKDSLEILLKVEIPSTQQDSINEMVASWVAQGRSAIEIAAVRTDVVTWWNRTELYRAGDKLYKKALRGLWWTIKNFKGEVRAELEKRLWDECKDAAIPYSVCTTGHLARLSNVMVGFDDAFVPSVPVGEVLQQKMAQISEMEVPYEKQIELAEAVLAELKIPAEEHKNWLAAF
jgi:hypothetical protein